MHLVYAKISRYKRANNYVKIDEMLHKLEIGVCPNCGAVHPEATTHSGNNSFWTNFKCPECHYTLIAHVYHPEKERDDLQVTIEVWKQRCVLAFAEKRLPVLPGDYILFNYDGARFLVTVSMPVEPLDNEVRGYPTMGQSLVGLMYQQNNGTTLTQITLDWSGYEEFWTIQRTRL